MSVKIIDQKEFFLDLLPRTTHKAFLAVIKLPLFLNSKWYLAGGTALALRVGHRQSVDLDFFTPNKKFRSLEIERELLATGNWQTSYLEKGTIYGEFCQAKMSLIAYPFFIPSKERLRCGTVDILLPRDIAAMKIIAISQRGRKRDFFDLYWYCQNQASLRDVIYGAIKQYPGQEHNLTHILKSLNYFADAEDDPMPKIYFNATWNDVKKFFRKEVPMLAREILRLPAR